MPVLQATDSKLCKVLRAGDPNRSALPSMRRGSRVDPMTTTDPLRPDTDGWPVCPSDSAAQAAWKQIADIAEAHCLIVQAYSGVMVLALPEEQRECKEPSTMRDDVLVTHRMRETVAIHGQDRP